MVAWLYVYAEMTSIITNILPVLNPFLSLSLSLSLHPRLFVSLISRVLALRMECCLLTVSALFAALFFALFYWLVQRNATWALLWHDFITERLRDTLTRSTRPQVTCFVFMFDLCVALTFKGFCYFSSFL